MYVQSSHGGRAGGRITGRRRSSVESAYLQRPFNSRNDHHNITAHESRSDQVADIELLAFPNVQNHTFKSPERVPLKKPMSGEKKGMLTDPKALKSGRESQIGTKWPLSNARIKQYPQRIEHITRPNVDKAKMEKP